MINAVSAGNVRRQGSIISFVIVEIINSTDNG